MNIKIITKNVIPNKIRIAFCLPVNLTSSVKSLFPYSAIIASCSCNDKIVEPLSAFTFLAYVNTKKIEIPNAKTQRTAPIAIIVPMFTVYLMPKASNASLAAPCAAPTANGLTVEPKTPEPAPNNTIADATIVSIPAATIVPDNNA